MIKDREIKNKKYIIIKDSQQNNNIWEITDELENQYIIQTRGNQVCVDKDKCLNKDDSPLLYCDCIIDIVSCSENVENKEKYKKELRKQRRQNIDPFRILDEIDLGYLEDMDNWWEWFNKE